MKRALLLTALSLLLTACPKTEKHAMREAVPTSPASVPPPASVASVAPSAEPAKLPAPVPLASSAPASERKAAALALLGGKAATSALPLAATDDGKPVDPSLRDQLSQRQRPSRVRIHPFEASPGLPKEVVARILRANLGRFRVCYQAGLRKNPNLHGQVTLSMVIDAKGVVKVTDTRSDLADMSVIKCIGAAAGKLRMPEPEGGAVVRVEPKLSFMSAD